jgi:hypothetical protein
MSWPQKPGNIIASSGNSSNCLERRENMEKTSGLALKQSSGESSENTTLKSKAETPLKFDAAKLPLHLLPIDALEAVAQVLEFGAKKYEANNWRKGFDHTRLYSAALRHIMSSLKGEDLDPESGLDHISHAACCVLFLLEHRLKGLGRDDRFIYDKK